MISMRDPKGLLPCSPLHRLAGLLAIVLLLAGLPSIAIAEGEPSWSAELCVRHFVGSHTSYEFGNPFPPGQKPLSRLEFPLNTWWAGGELRRRFSRLSFGLEALTNISRRSTGSFKDSDWDDDYNPGLKTIYSEADCRMEPSYLVRGDMDLKVSDWLGLPDWFDLRPVIGFRWQRFELVAYDGIEFYPDPGPIPGDTIRFEQVYRQYFLGFRMSYDLTRHIRSLPLHVNFQVDRAHVDGDNSDHHLLRAGKRWTYEETSGEAWHASLGIKAALTKRISAGMEVEYLRIETTGTHRLDNNVFDIDIHWDHGVEAWSEQKCITISLEYRF